MKIRLGFVSNSSSSSFIAIPNDKIKTIFDLGKKMLEIRNKDSDFSSENSEACLELEKIKEAERLNINLNTPITFQTINYRTYIRLNHYREFVVDTCNNIDWFALEEKIKIQEREEILEPQIDKVYFWWIKEGLVGKPVTNIEWNEFCSKNNFSENIRSWRQCWKEKMHFYEIVKVAFTDKIECVQCYYLENKLDMLLTPKKSKVKSIKIRKPVINFRGKYD